MSSWQHLLLDKHQNGVDFLMEPIPMFKEKVEFWEELKNNLWAFNIIVIM